MVLYKLTNNDKEKSKLIFCVEHLIQNYPNSWNDITTIKKVFDNNKELLSLKFDPNKI